MIIFRCLECNKEFTKTANQQKFCSVKCAKLNWEKRNPDKVKKYKKEGYVKLKEKMKTDPTVKIRLNNNQKRWRNKKSSKDTLKKRDIAAAIKRKQVRLDNIEMMGCACWLCGFSEYTSTLEFHHVNGRVFPNQHKALENPRSKKFKAEECIIACSNCHQEYHCGDHITKEEVIDIWKKVWLFLNSD